MTAIIVEDESLIARQLISKIEAIAPDIKILDIIPSLKVARRWLMANAEPDLMFMDIQLSDGVSFEIFEEFNLRCPVIFTTAYDEYAIKAFKVNGVDYLLKPVNEDDLRKAIEKSRKIIGSKDAVPANWGELLQSLSTKQQAATLYKEKFIVHQRNQWLPINTTDIAYFTRENLNYLITFEGTKYILDYNTMEEIEELLDPRKFYRANRQFIINIDAIQSVKPHDNAKLSVFLKMPLKIETDISREKAPAFKKWFDR